MITGKEQERPEPYLFNRDANFVQAAAGWAHCDAVTDKGEVFTWGWSECVPNANTATSDGQGAPCGASNTNRYRQGTNTRAYSSTRLNQYSTIVLRVLPSTGTGVSVGSV
ncbi:hypothetical protein R1flu_002438 [Riccia fluitans]|uniref:Uncharacterized protein n=1 Tax=Riccia fluitans TaxID=41844 RepID=A0ABD1Y6E5_9MARC